MNQTSKGGLRKHLTRVMALCLALMSLATSALASFDAKVYSSSMPVYKKASVSSKKLGSLKKGTKVFYLGTTGAYYRICSEYGPRGYIYKGYASYYGAVALNSIYECDGATKMYKSASTRSKRVTTLRDGQYVVVYAVSGKWAYVHTISGKKGYVPVSKLQKP